MPAWSWGRGRAAAHSELTEAGTDISADLCFFDGCGSDVTVPSVQISQAPEVWEFWVHCPKCTSFGPTKRTKLEAVGAWNVVARAVRTQKADIDVPAQAVRLTDLIAPCVSCGSDQGHEYIRRYHSRSVVDAPDRRTLTSSGWECRNCGKSLQEPER